MNYIKYVIIFLSTLLLNYATCLPVSAYSVTITWVGPGTGFIGISFLIEGNAFNGPGILESKEARVIRDDSRQFITVEHAGAWKGPFNIPEGYTVQFNFDEANIGKCFDTAELKFGTLGDKGPRYAFQYLPIKAVKDSYYSKLQGALADFGQTVTKSGETVGQIQDPKGIGVAVGAATQAIGGVVGSVGKLVKMSTCKNWSALVTYNKDGALEAYSPNF